PGIVRRVDALGHPAFIFPEVALPFSRPACRQPTACGFRLTACMLRDVKYAWRGLARAPLFTLVAIASIALGIGANTAIFTLVDEVLIRLLPVKAPEQLVLFTGSRNHYGSNSGGNMLSFPMYEDFRDNFVDRGAGGASAGPAPALPRISQSVPN